MELLHHFNICLLLAGILCVLMFYIRIYRITKVRERKRRLEIYRKMLARDWPNDPGPSHYYHGFCQSIIVNSEYRLITKFPELMKYKPNTCEDPENTYWFESNVKGYFQRREILIDIIHQMEKSS